MFQASLARAASSDVRQARKMAEIEARAKEKFRATALDPEVVRRQLELRNVQDHKSSLLRNKKSVKNRGQSSVMADGGAISELALQQKKLRSKKILYGSTGQEVEYHPGDTVRLGDWPEFHTSHKYNGSVGVIVARVTKGNADDVTLTDLTTKREFSTYSVRIPFVKVRASIQPNRCACWPAHVHTLQCSRVLRHRRPCRKHVTCTWPPA
jgi:hypothetical protein